MPHPTATYVVEHRNMRVVSIYKLYTHTRIDIVNILQTTPMSLLQAVEDHLGTIDTWPSYIIRYLFFDTPTPQVVEEVTASFICNGVPKTLACRLYHACNPRIKNDLVRELFYLRYFIWQTSKTVRRMSRYYDVCM
jgi:hypothetical protein